MTAKEILKLWLVENGYDGLACDECGCSVDDLAPCDAFDPCLCAAAYRHECETCDLRDERPFDCCAGDHCYRDEKRSDDARCRD